MPRLPAAPAPNLGQEMAQAYLVNDRMNQLLLERLDPRAWRAKLPAQKGRTIADIFAHVHNIRGKWLRLSAPHLKRPARLDRRRCTQKQARTALAESALRSSEMLAEALNDPQGRVPSFLRDGWARPWPPGAAMFAYMMTHDAHHRGQACMLAHQLGYRLPVAVGAAMWGWEKLAKQCGFQALASRKTKRPAAAGRRTTKAKSRSITPDACQ
jgi:uncharacterized damage-inducible protein DinB